MMALYKCSISSLKHVSYIVLSGKISDEQMLFVNVYQCDKCSCGYTIKHGLQLSYYIYNRWNLLSPFGFVYFLAQKSYAKM